MPNNQNKNSGIRSLPCNIRLLEDSGRQVELSFSSEEPYQRWFGNEILCHDEHCVDLSRVGEVATVLFHHGYDTNYGHMPIGQIVKAWVENGRGKAIISFDTDDDSEKVYQKVKSGSLKGVSVGYNVSCWETVKAGGKSSNGRFDGPCEVATKWEVIEISIEPTPADPTVGVGRAIENLGGIKTMGENDNNQNGAQDTGANTIISQAQDTGVKTIDTQTQSTQQAPQGSAPVSNNQSSIEQERTRSLSITTLCRTHKIDDADMLSYISGGQSVGEVREAILSTLEKRNAPLSGMRVNQTENSGQQAFIKDMSDGLAMRAGVRIETPSTQAKRLTGMRLRDIAVESLAIEGESNAHRMSDDELFKRALTPQSAFVSILDNTVNKSVESVTRVYTPTFKAWTGTGSVSDFKGTKHYRISDTGELELMREGSEFKFDELSDEAVSKSVLTYGKMFGFTREALINDDLDVLSKIPQSYITAVWRGINKMVYRTLGKNPIIYDGRELFGDYHANDAGDFNEFGTKAISAMKRLMRSQRDISGKNVLNITPSAIIVPTSLEDMAMQFLSSISDISMANPNAKNIYHNAFDVVADAELDQYSEDNFYMVANPMLCESIEVTYLQGHENPTLENNILFDRLGIQWRIFHDVGVNIVDFRGIVKGSITNV